MLLALFVITAVSGGLLGLVYGMTKDAIAEVDLKKNQAAIEAVLNTGTPIDRIEETVIDELPCNLAYDAQGNLLGAAIKTHSNTGLQG